MSGHVIRLRGALALVLLFSLLLNIRPAMAAQTPPCSASPSTASLTLPSVSIAPGQANGKIGSSTQVAVTFDCVGAFFNTDDLDDSFVLRTGNFTQRDTATTPPGGKGVMFLTDMPGIDVWLTAKQTQATDGNNGPDGSIGWNMGTIKCHGYTNNYSCNSSNGFSGTATFTVQLYKKGPTGIGTVGAINLLGFFDSNTNFTSASSQFGTLVLNPTQLTASSCSVSMPSANFTVTLPTLGASAFGGTGSVAGTTPFVISYACPAGWNLAMTMSTASPGSTAGVMLSTSSGACSGSAGNVGVQLLQSNMQPVAFDAYQSLGASPNGPLTLTYYAQYYQTGAPIAPGQVCTTATYTMTYQ